jgi:CRP-like cAMP-binding protein
MSEVAVERSEIRIVLEADLQALRALPLLGGFPDHLLVALQNTARLVHFGSGEALFPADEPLGEVYYLLSGEVGATRPRAGGEDVVDILLPVRPLCLPAVLLGLPAPIGARTLTGGHLITLSASLLRETIGNDPKLMRSVFEAALRDAHDLVVAHYSGRMRTVIQRVAEYLLERIEDPEERPARFILQDDNERLAARFACTTQGVTDAFEKLRRVGVQKQNRAVVIEDAVALERLARSAGQMTKRRANVGGRPRKLVVVDGGKAAPPPPRLKNTSVDKRICKVPGCGKPVNARGYCPAHYRMTRPICKVPGCTKRSQAFGYCPSHYQRWRSHGDVSLTVRPPRLPKSHGDLNPTPQPRRLPLDQRLNAYTRRGEGCWEWTGSKDPKGHGLLKVDGKTTLATRLAYRLHCGDLPEGMDVRHKCGHPWCVNPEHLFLAPRARRAGQEQPLGQQESPTEP